MKTNDDVTNNSTGENNKNSQDNIEIESDSCSIDENKQSQETSVLKQESKEKEIKRGVKFRKSILKEIPYIDYTDMLNTKTLNLKSCLNPILDIKAQDFLNTLKILIPKK
jgi:hypothetical protein